MYGPFDMPGPRRFVDDIVDDLRNGKSVVLQAPQQLCQGLIAAVRDEMVRDSDVRWSPLEYTGGSPIIQLHSYLGRTGWRVALPSVGSLYGAPGFPGQVIEVVNMSAAAAGEWVQFLREFAEFSRGLPELQRTQFVLCFSGPGRSVIEQEEMLLVGRIMSGVVDRWDMQHFAYCASLRRTMRVIERELLVTIAAGLALWDFQLCRTLCNQPIGRLLNPGPVLMSFAEELGWGEHGVQEDALWQEGVLHKQGSEALYHSAYLAIRGDMETVCRRLWEAELSVLLPYVEAQRQRVLARYGASIELPHTDSDGRTVVRLEDMEIGNLAYHMACRPSRFGRELRLHLGYLRDVRNALAHNETVNPRLLDAAMINAL